MSFLIHHKEPAKKVVLKSEYIRRCLVSAIARMAGYVARVATVIWVVVAPIEFFLHTEALYSGYMHWLIAPLLIFLMAVIVGYGMFVLQAIGFDLVEHSKKIKSVVPITRTMASDLPPREIFVRASKESPTAPEITLLRPAAHTSTPPPEQMVRPYGVLE